VAKPINPDNPSVMLRLTLERKQRLAALASHYGCDTISQFVSNIADGKISIITEDAKKLLEYIQFTMSNRK
jgi:hypothetical protein